MLRRRQDPHVETLVAIKTLVGHDRSECPRLLGHLELMESFGQVEHRKQTSATDLIDDIITGLGRIARTLRITRPADA